MDINLVPAEEKAAEGFENLKRRLIFVSMGLLALTAISTLGVLIFFVILSSRRANLEARRDNSLVEIASYKSTEELLAVIGGKSQTAGKVLGSRIETGNYFTKLSELVPQNVYFTDVKLAADKAVFSGKAKTSLDMAGLVSALVGAKGSEILNNVSVDSLSSDENGVYTFIVSAQIVKNTKK